LGVDHGVEYILDDLGHRRSGCRRSVGDAAGQGVDVALEVAARHRSVDDAVGGRLLAGEVTGRQQYFQGAGRPDLHRQAGGAASGREDSTAGFG